LPANESTGATSLMADTAAAEVVVRMKLRQVIMMNKEC
jgi:hypothetical protein